MTTALWIYLSSSKPAESMAHSIRLAQSNISGIDNWVVIGDRPPSNSVEWIRCPKISHGEYERRTGTKLETSTRNVDAIFKLLRAIESPIVSERFLLLYDDHFVLRQTTADELSKHRSRGHVRPGTKPNKGWQELRRQTFIELQNRGFETHDYSDRQIICYEKKQLFNTINEFELTSRGLLVESIYPNQLRVQPEKLRSDWFRYVTCSNEWPAVEPNYINLQNGRWNEHRHRITNHGG